MGCESINPYSTDVFVLTRGQGMLRREGFDEEGELDEVIQDLSAAIAKARRAEAAAAAEEPEEEAPPEEPTFPLLDVPDADLDEEQLKEKRRQRLMKAGYDGRMRAKAEKERLRREAEESRQREQLEREDDFEGWKQRVRTEHDVSDYQCLFASMLTYPSGRCIQTQRTQASTCSTR